MDSVKIIEINYANSINLVARQPKISVQGKTIFTELYSTGELFQKTQAYGQDLTVMGTTKFTIYLSDTYSWASSLDASGIVERSPPLLRYNELSSLPYAIFWVLILFPVFLALAYKVSFKNTAKNLEVDPA